MESIHRNRKELGLKITDLAKAVGIDASLMSRINSGKRLPTLVQMKKISEVLSLDFEVLLKEVLSNQLVELLSPYPQLADDVMAVAEERIADLSGKNKFNVIKLTKRVAKLVSEADTLHAIWQNKKPISDLQVQKMQEFFHTAYTYESNRLEGNTLSLSETHLVVNEGITIGGKSMREHLELINHKEAIDLILDFVTKKIHFNPFYLKQIHQLVLKGIHKENAGVY